MRTLHHGFAEKGRKTANTSIHDGLKLNIQAELELEDKIREKRKEIEALEAQLAEEKARHLHENAKKKQKCDEHFTSPDPIKGEEFLLKRVETMLTEMKELSSKKLPAAILLYSEIHKFLLTLTGPQLSLPIEEFTMEQVDTLDMLKTIIRKDLGHLTHLRTLLGSTGNFLPERLAAMARKVDEVRRQMSGRVDV